MLKSVWRRVRLLLLFVAVFGIYTVAFFVAVKYLVAAGYISEQMNADIKDVLLIFISIPGIFALIYTARSLEHSRITTRVETLKEVLWSFLNDDEERKFFYKLDYKQWEFDPDTFRGSEYERNLDGMIYKLCFLGYSHACGAMDTESLGVFKFITATVFYNPEVQKYLGWVRVDVPGHSSFRDAYYLHKVLFPWDHNALLTTISRIKKHYKAERKALQAGTKSA